MVGEDRLRTVQGALLVAGGGVAAMSLQHATLSTARVAAIGLRDPPLPQAVPTVSVGLALLALGFLVAVVADVVAGETGRAVLSGGASLSLVGLVVGLVVGPRLVTLASGAVLLLAGIGMLVFLADTDRLRSRLPV